MHTADSEEKEEEQEDFQVNSLEEAKEQIRQLRELVRSLGGLEPVKASSAKATMEEKLAIIDTHAAKSSNASAPIIMDTAKFGARLFLAVQKKQKILLAINRDGQVVSFEPA